MIDTKELRRLALDGDLAAMQEIILRLEAAEKARDDIAQQLVQSERDKRAISEECDALRNEIAYVKEVEFPRKAQAVADAWKGKCKRLEVERDILRARIEAMEKQEPVGWLRLYRDGSDSEDFTNLPDVFERQRPLYALPGAQNVASVPDAVMVALENLDDYIARIEGNDRGACGLINLVRRYLLDAAEVGGNK